MILEVGQEIIPSFHYQARARSFSKWTNKLLIGNFQNYLAKICQDLNLKCRLNMLFKIQAQGSFGLVKKKLKPKYLLEPSSPSLSLSRLRATPSWLKLIDQINLTYKTLPRNEQTANLRRFSIITTGPTAEGQKCNEMKWNTILAFLQSPKKEGKRDRNQLVIQYFVAAFNFFPPLSLNRNNVNKNRRRRRRRNRRRRQ